MAGRAELDRGLVRGLVRVADVSSTPLDAGVLVGRNKVAFCLSQRLVRREPCRTGRRVGSLAFKDLRKAKCRLQSIL
jgi:hypothetical protein